MIRSAYKAASRQLTNRSTKCLQSQVETFFGVSTGSIASTIVSLAQLPSAGATADLGVPGGEVQDVCETLHPTPPGAYSGNHSAPRSRDITANR
jgi:hypothetical protein